jgi:hypothetical protein
MNVMRILPFVRISLLLLYSVLSTEVLADGIVVDKVYHPYVLPNEREVEWRMISRQKDEGRNLLSQRIAYGQSVSETVMMEFYIVGERSESDDFRLQAYEIETRWMLTEQGEYWADWGALLEIEKEHDVNNWELTSGLLFEKEFGRTSLTMNMFIIYEWGDELESEIETEFRLQYRYRWLPEIQPAIEIYTGEDYQGIGPAFMGIHRFEGQKQLKWEAAFITGINRGGKDHTLRIAIEYEF